MVIDEKQHKHWLARTLRAKGGAAWFMAHMLILLASFAMLGVFTSAWAAAAAYYAAYPAAADYGLPLWGAALVFAAVTPALYGAKRRAGFYVALAYCAYIMLWMLCDIICYRAPFLEFAALYAVLALLVWKSRPVFGIAALPLTPAKNN